MHIRKPRIFQCNVCYSFYFKRNVEGTTNEPKAGWPGKLSPRPLDYSNWEVNLEENSGPTESLSPLGWSIYTFGKDAWSKLEWPVHVWAINYSRTWTSTQCNSQHWVPVMATPETPTGFTSGQGWHNGVRWIKRDLGSLLRDKCIFYCSSLADESPRLILSCTRVHSVEQAGTLSFWHRFHFY